jgi:hypothetical protein
VPTVVASEAIFFIATIPFFAFRAVGSELEPGPPNATLFGTAIKV